MRDNNVKGAGAWVRDTREARLKLQPGEKKVSTAAAVNRAADKYKWSGSDRNRVAKEYK